MTEIEWIEKEIHRSEEALKRAQEKKNAPQSEAHSIEERITILYSIKNTLIGRTQ